jgi:hypothetical protein
VDGSTKRAITLSSQKASKKWLKSMLLLLSDSSSAEAKNDEEPEASLSQAEEHQLISGKGKTVSNVVRH